MFGKTKFSLVLSLLIANPSLSLAKDTASLENLDLSALLKQHTAIHRESDTASSVSESLRDAPAAMVVISERDIKRRGYDSIDDILADLPGFDTIVTNGTMHVVSYQRGYRTPWTQRTLFLIDGKVDNNIWMHAANFSRQYPMSAIKRIEVLYGPSGAVYGPNAFLGVVNVITKNAEDLLTDEHKAEINVQAGSFNSQAIDLNLRGKYNELSYSFGLRLFESDEPGIDDYSKWGFTEEHLLADPRYWGAGIGGSYDPANNQRYSPAGDINVDGRVSGNEKFNGHALGHYFDPSKNRGVLANVYWRNWTLGVISWDTEEGYGPYYSFMDGQPNAVWFHSSDQLFLKNNFQWTKKLKVTSEWVYRENSSGGDWVESFGGYVSVSDWLSNNSAWRFEQQYDYQFNEKLLITTGIKYEHKDLTKSYMICNYWDGIGYCPAQAHNSSNGLTSDGSGVIEAANISSANPSPLPPHLGSDIPDFNLLETNDKGIFTQAIYDIGKWRLNAGIRWDKNNIYGSEVSPRGAAIFHWTNRTSLKFIYGEAFQEPSPKDLYGSWNGRDANADLLPEKVKNTEIILIHQSDKFVHDISFFHSHYHDAITSSANVGGRDIYGIEYRNRFRFRNFISNSGDITGNLYYTYTETMSDQQYDNVLGEWVNKKDDQGDIAPHKVSFILNLPIRQNWNFNLQGNWLAKRDLFSQNPLRADSNSARVTNRQAEAYTTVDINLLYKQQKLEVGFKIENLFEEDYLAPGVESAGSGDDFSQDYDGFQNSLIPQVNKRSFTINIRMEY